MDWTLFVVLFRFLYKVNPTYKNRDFFIIFFLLYSFSLCFSPACTRRQNQHSHIITHKSLSLSWADAPPHILVRRKYYSSSLSLSHRIRRAQGQLRRRVGVSQAKLSRWQRFAWSFKFTHSTEVETDFSFEWNLRWVSIVLNPSILIHSFIHHRHHHCHHHRHPL